MAIACLLATPTCLCQQISGVDFDDGGQTPLFDAGPDAGDAGAGKTGADAGRDAGVDAGRDSGVPPFPDSGGAACDHPVSDLDVSANYPVGNVGWIASADLNGDGLLDVIASDENGVEVLLGGADGALRAWSSNFFDAPWFAVGDVNGDGSPDLVLSTNAGPYGLTVFLNDGEGRLTQLPVIPTPYITTGIVIGDLDGDGRPDLLADTCDGTNPDDPKTWSWEVFFQLGDGGFSAPTLLDIPPGSDATALLGDPNGDGLLDLVTTTLDQAHVAVLLNQGGGAFETTLYQAQALGQIALLPRPGRLPDLVIGESGFNDAAGQTALGIGVMANAGDGTFAEPVTYPNPGGNIFAIGDFNGDCILDIASPPNLQYCQAGWPLSVIYGDAAGGFGASVNLTYAGQGAYGIAALGPVDDPRAIAVGDYCGGGITVYGDASKH